MERRLAAVVMADVVGYSRLIRADESGTICALRDAKVKVVDPAFDRYRGRIVKLMGDGILAEFPSAVDAVSASLEIQQEISSWNKDRPKDRRIAYRVGVNLGDVVRDGDDIQGDGVNVASRLEALAEPGAICVSEAVHDQVRDRLNAEFVNLGEQQVKNLDRPVKVWQWTDTDAILKVRPERAKLLLPSKPSIAVLPFDNMSGDPEQEFFADGISEDLITALSRNRELFVIARNSSFSYRGNSVDVRLVGRSLGVRFVLEGSVRRSGNQMRITAQLVEAESGAHVWAEKYDRPLTEIFQIQDEITMNVAGAVGSEIRAADIRAVANKSVENLRSWERLMKAYWHIYRPNAKDNAIGQEICRHEIAETGGNAEIFAALVFACVFELAWGLGDRTPQEVIRDGLTAGRTAIELDASDDFAHGNLSFLLWISGDHDAAIREASAAIELNPSLPWGYLALGGALAYSGTGNFDAAIENLEYSIRLGPRDLLITWSYCHMATASFLVGKYEEAQEYARTAIRHDPTNGTAHRWLAAALEEDGQNKAARAAWVRAWEVQPLDLAEYFASVHRMFKSDADANRYLVALKRAGAPFE